MNGNLKPFEASFLDLPPLEQFIWDIRNQHPTLTREQAQWHYERLQKDTIWVNDEYQVNIDTTPEHGFPGCELWHVSIKRRDKQPIHDWRDLQTIKNMLCGPEYEAIELYPCSERVVDTSNQYHTWAFLSGERIPVSMTKTGPKPKPVAQRLWEKVDMSAGPDACWPFIGASNGKKGYGVLSEGGDSTGKSPLYAHRLAYCLANGLDYQDLQRSQEVRHSCDRPACCNPQHLSLGTSKDNKADAIAKGRMFWQKAQRDAKGQFVKDPDVEDD